MKDFFGNTIEIGDRFFHSNAMVCGTVMGFGSKRDRVIIAYNTKVVTHGRDSDSGEWRTLNTRIVVKETIIYRSEIGICLDKVPDDISQVISRDDYRY